jgi:outer membrane receptor protein involved in Fe transport
VTGGAVQQADLRGLGVNRTLTLVNGRRLTPANPSFGADMGTIPTSLVERVDVVTGGASAAYGSDAVAGVVNFVLNTKLNGFKGGLQAGVSGHGDQRETVFNLGYGADIGDRFHFVVGADYGKDDGTGNLYQRKIFRSEPGIVARIGAGAPAQSFADGVESAFTPGGIISAGALRGTAFTNSGVPYAFSYGTVVGGNQIGATSNYGLSPLLVVQLRHPFERYNGMFAANYDVNDHVQIFTELTGAFNASSGGFGDTTQTNYVISASNAFIPASVRTQLAARGLTNFTLGRYNTDISSYTSQQRYHTKRAVLGVRGDTDAFGTNWEWEVYGQLGRTRGDAKYDHMYDVPNLLAALHSTTDANGNAVCAPAATNPNITAANEPQRTQAQPGCVPFNPFGQTNSAAALDYVLGTLDAQIRIHQDVAGASFSGAPFTLPAGDVSLAFGGEVRKESIDAKGDPRSTITAWQTLSQGTYAGSNSVKEVFAEVGVPLLKDEAFAKSLDLNAAIRRTDYRISGAVTTWKIGGTWEPTDFLRFRVTKSRDVRAPSVPELFVRGSVAGQGNFFNPFTGQNELRINLLTTGSTALTPERADSFTAGVIFQPHWGFTEGFKASFDYYNIEVKNVIGNRTATEIVQGCFAGNQIYCSSITFDTGRRITDVRVPFFNFASLETEGLDIELAYRVPLASLPFDVPGTLDIRNLTTITSKNSRSDGVTKIDRNGFANGGTAKMTGNATVDYAVGRFKGGLQARYFADVHWDPALVGPDSPFYNPALANSISRNLFPGQVLFNANASYDIVNGDGRTLQIYAIVNNVFDRAPSKQGAIAFNQNGVQYYDLIGRLFRVGARFSF